jgi:Tfp pilus assembly protein PilZ
MEKRAFQRFPVKLQSRLFYGNMIYTGIVTNLSENGMFISTKVNFPVDSVFIAIILLDANTISVPIKIRRTVRAEQSTGNGESGLGVGLLNTSKAYLDFVSKTMASLSNIKDNNILSDQIDSSIDLS